MRFCLSIFLFLCGISLFAENSGTRVQANENFSNAFRLQCRDENLNELIEETLEVRQELCQCLQSHARSTRICLKGGDLDKWMKHFSKVLKSESLEGLATNACQTQLRESQLKIFLSFLKNRCRTHPEETLKQLTFNEKIIQDPNRCWRVTGMTPEGCLTVKSCTEKGALLSSLGVSSTEIKKEAVFCNPSLQGVHQKRDRLQFNAFYMRPLTQSYLMNPVSQHSGGQYAQSNCHGTALEIAGNFFRDKDVPSISLPPAYEQVCRPYAEALFNRARQGNQNPTIGSLGLSDGVSINMKYENCNENECGSASLNALWCTNGNLRSFAFLDGMCIHCWDKKIRASGFYKLGENTGWENLKPGCILTQKDHTVTLVLASEGMCYYYETPNPGGAPQLLVSACPAFYARFPWRWCPTLPLSFSEQ